jgi:hypothetical protein
MTLLLFLLHLFPKICKMYIQKSAEDCKNFQNHFDFVLNFLRLNIPSIFLWHFCSLPIFSIFYHYEILLDKKKFKKIYIMLIFTWGGKCGWKFMVMPLV